MSTAGSTGPVWWGNTSNASAQNTVHSTSYQSISMGGMWTGTTLSSIPLFVTSVEIVDGVAICKGASGEVLLTISLEAVRRILDSAVLDAFIGEAKA